MPSTDVRKLDEQVDVSRNLGYAIRGICWVAAYGTPSLYRWYASSRENSSIKIMVDSTPFNLSGEFARVIDTKK